VTTASLLQFLFSGLMVGAIYGLVALGLNIVFNATGAVNFAQGEFAMLGGMIGASLFSATGLPLALVVVVTVVAVTAVGIAMERLIVRPIRHADVLNLIIVTIGASILLKGGVMVTLGKNAGGLPAFTGERPLRVLGATFVPQALWIVGVACAIVIALHLFFDRTLLGKAMRAVASDREAARLMGIDTSRIVMLSFALGAAVGAIGGLIVTPVTLTIYDAGTMLGLKGFAAAVTGSLEVRRGELVALIGANGAGKSTLLRSIAGLLTPSAGRVTVDGSDVTGRPPEAVIRAGIAMVPERRRVFADLSVLDNLELGGYALPRGREFQARLDAGLEEAYRLFPVLHHRRAQLAGTLSGGEQQMLAIGRALMSRPRLLLCDEPSLGLAPLIVHEIMRLLARLREEGTTILLVEQNARMALRAADRAYVLETGRVALSGTGAALIEDEQLKAAYLGG
jgi:ABC-type branched-subunit amino acid transport system ATPase component/ABC-type branched-subunit amino acid transport system permease subunit